MDLAGKTPHRDVELDGLSLLEAQVQFGSLLGVLSLSGQLALLPHPPTGTEHRAEDTATASLRLPGKPCPGSAPLHPQQLFSGAGWEPRRCCRSNVLQAALGDWFLECPSHPVPPTLPIPPCPKAPRSASSQSSAPALRSSTQREGKELGKVSDFDPIFAALSPRWPLHAGQELAASSSSAAAGDIRQKSGAERPELT